VTPRAAVCLRPDRAGMQLLVMLVVAVSTAAVADAQGRWVDVASGEVERVAVLGDSLTFEEFPPYAFGAYPVGTPPLYLEMFGLDCAELPSTGLCDDDVFIVAVQAAMERGNCPCTGVLFEASTIQVRYDEAAVQALGAREADLRLMAYDETDDTWGELFGGTTIDEGQNVVRATQAAHVVQIYAVIVDPPTEPASWGAIKAQWSR